MIQNIVGGKDLRAKIAEHMGKDPSQLQIVTEEFEQYNHPNLQLAINEFINTPGRTATLLGVQGGAVNLMGTGMAEIVAPRTLVNSVGFGGAKEGPVQYANIEIAADEKLACVNGGLYLISDRHRLAVLLRAPMAMFGGGGGPQIEVLAESRQAGEEFIAFVRNTIARVNVYRGKILSVSAGQGAIEGMRGSTGLKFHRVPEISRDKIILPEGLLQRIERQTVAAGQYSEALKRAKRKLKRGILLHGRPGTGKTLTAMYIASAMKDRTVLVLTGRGLGLIETSAKLARWLAPSMVLIEDVDLIAEDRLNSSCTQPVLFELLNQMDGLADDCDVLFVLTTNRPEILEPALASRPGRVDQAYEVPLPDAECRRRLFELYFEGLTVKVENLDSLIKRTSGASAAFIAELVRKAALFAAPEGDPIVVHDRHLDEAMHELLLIGGSVTKSLLGFGQIGFTVPERAAEPASARVNKIAEADD